MNLDRKKANTAVLLNTLYSKLLMGVGMFFLIVFSISTFLIAYNGFQEAISKTVMVVVFLILAGCIFYRGLIRSKELQLYHIYVDYFDKDSKHSINRLAENTGMPVELVVENLQEMIKKKYFPNAHIDPKKNRLIFQADASENSAPRT